MFAVIVVSYCNYIGDACRNHHYTGLQFLGISSRLVLSCPPSVLCSIILIKMQFITISMGELKEGVTLRRSSRRASTRDKKKPGSPLLRAAMAGSVRPETVERLFEQVATSTQQQQQQSSRRLRNRRSRSVATVDPSAFRKVVHALNPDLSTQRDVNELLRMMSDRDEATHVTLEDLKKGIEQFAVLRNVVLHLQAQWQAK